MNEQALEQRLRKARRDVFSDDPTVEAHAAAEIAECQRLLAPYWAARNAQVEHAHSERMLFLWD